MSQKIQLPSPNLSITKARPSLMNSKNSVKTESTDSNRPMQNCKKISKPSTTIPTSTTTSTLKTQIKTVHCRINSEGVPENLKKKLHQIEANGGKPKIELEIGIIKKSSVMATQSFQGLRKMLEEEEQFDNQKRSQYR